MNQKGFSLFETVIYIGIFAILIPSFMGIILGFVQKSQAIEMRIRLEEKAATIRSELQYELTQAGAIDVTNSVFGTDDSYLVFKDPANTSVTMKRTSASVTFPTGVKTVHRLERQTVAGNEWMTDADTEVSVWNIEPVRNVSGTLTGLNVHLTMRMLSTTGVALEKISLTTDTSLNLEPQTTEL